MKKKGRDAMLEVSERHWTSKARLLRLLEDLENAGWCRHTLYLKPESLNINRAREVALETNINEGGLRAVLDEIGPSETGLAIFLGEDRAMAIAPPFPLWEDSYSMWTDADPLLELLNKELIVGVVLLRLGRYAVGVLRGEYLSASKTDTRHVKNRHRAGGSSQRRFERSRERLVRELYDKTCEVVRDVYSSFDQDIDYILMGGERNTLRGFTERCRYIRDFGPKVLSRLLQVDRPNKDALLNISFEVWKSRVISFASIE